MCDCATEERELADDRGVHEKCSRATFDLVIATCLIIEQIRGMDSQYAAYQGDDTIIRLCWRGTSRQKVARDAHSLTYF